MPRKPRMSSAGTIFHVLNRANSKLEAFEQQLDYKEFIDLLISSLKKYKVEIYAYILMPTHWHIVCSPKADGEISVWMAWLQMMHTQKWHMRHMTVGRGHFYQGRYKAFIIQNDGHFLRVCKYVERNALRAGLVRHAEDWPWSSLATNNLVPIASWPVQKPLEYLRFVNEDDTRAELAEIRDRVKRSAPYGNGEWIETLAKVAGSGFIPKKLGRPKKGSDPFSSCILDTTCKDTERKDLKR